MAEVRKIVQVENSSPLMSRKKKKQIYITGAVLLALAGALVAALIISTGGNIRTVGDYTVAQVTSGTLTTSTEASGSVVLPTQVSIVSMETGYAREIYVGEGDTITETTVLAVLDVPDLEESRDDILDDLETQKINLEEIVLNNEYALRELELSIGRIEGEIAEAGEVVRTEKELLDLKSSRLSEYEAAVDALEALEEKREDLLLEQEKTIRSGELSIKKQQAQINQLEVSLERILTDIQAASITSPIAGDILSLEEDLTVKGSLIEQNTALFTVADTDDVYIDLEVYEQYGSYLEIGGTMDLLISNNVVKAEITRIGRVASMSSDGLAATITVRARPLGVTDLTPGATAVAEIPLGTKEEVLLLPRGSYLTTGGQKYVYKIDGDLAYKSQVIFGEIQGSQVEVLSGLEEGDRVIISSYQDFIDQDVVELKD